MGTEEVVCKRDGIATRLGCAECDAPVCPACMVRTPVGFKCLACAGGSSATGGRRPVTLLVVGGVVVAVAVLLVGATLVRSPGGTASDPIGAAAGGAAEAPTAQAMIGEEAVDGQLAFVVDDFSCAPKPAGTVAGKLCRLHVTIRNTSGGPALFLGRFQYLLDGQSRTYGPDDGLTRAVPENEGRATSELTVNPDVVVPLVLVFDIPSTVDPTEAQFKGTGRSRFGVNVRLQRRS